MPYKSHTEFVTRENHFLLFTKRGNRKGLARNIKGTKINYSKMHLLKTSEEKHKKHDPLNENKVVNLLFYPADRAFLFSSVFSH